MKTFAARVILAAFGLILAGCGASSQPCGCQQETARLQPASAECWTCPLPNLPAWELPPLAERDAPECPLLKLPEWSCPQPRWPEWELTLPDCVRFPPCGPRR
jgi:hypothetical protein